MTWAGLQITLLTGLATGLFLTLIAIGLSIVFGLQGVINFAHGTFYMLGAYSLVMLQSHVPYVGIAIVATIIIGGIGILFYGIFLINLKGRPHLDYLLTTFGAALIITEIVRWFAGSAPQFAQAPEFLSGVVQLGAIVFPRFYLVMIVVCAILMAIGWYVFQRTLLGARVRATVEDGEMAEAVGINALILNLSIFAAGAAVAGLAGVLAGPVFTIYPDMDLDIIVLVFAVVIFGGLGSLVGTLIGGIVIGMIQAFGTVLFNSTVAQIGVFILMAVTVIIRPQGLLGKRHF